LRPLAQRLRPETGDRRSLAERFSGAIDARKNVVTPEYRRYY